MNQKKGSVFATIKATLSSAVRGIASSFDSIQVSVVSAVNVVPAAVYLYCALAIIIAMVPLLTSDLLPSCGYLAAPNVLFLGFVLAFGLIGLSDKVKIQFWGVISLLIGILMWLLSAWMSTLPSYGCAA